MEVMLDTFSNYHAFSLEKETTGTNHMKCGMSMFVIRTEDTVKVHDSCTKPAFATETENTGKNFSRVFLREKETNEEHSLNNNPSTFAEETENASETQSQRTLSTCEAENENSPERGTRQVSHAFAEDIETKEIDHANFVSTEFAVENHNNCCPLSASAVNSESTVENTVLSLDAETNEKESVDYNVTSALSAETENTFDRHNSVTLSTTVEQNKSTLENHDDQVSSTLENNAESKDTSYFDLSAIYNENKEEDDTDLAFSAIETFMCCALRFYRYFKQEKGTMEYGLTDISLTEYAKQCIALMACHQAAEPTINKALILVQTDCLDALIDFMKERYEDVDTTSNLIEWMSKCCLLSAALFEEGFVEVPKLVVELIHEKCGHHLRYSRRFGEAESD